MYISRIIVWLWLGGVAQPICAQGCESYPVSVRYLDDWRAAQSAMRHDGHK